MPDKLTDNEIKKALECCSQQGITSECERCKVKGCRSELIKLALDLINRLQADRDRLTIVNKTLAKQVKEYNDLKDAVFKALVERISKIMSNYKNT